MSQVDEITTLLNTTQNKSDSPTEFESALRDAFDFLGFSAKLIGGSGDSDVLLSANLGQQSFKVSVDGKTSKDGKVIDRQIDWTSLEDHKKKNSADFVLVVGPDFAKGNLITRACDKKVSLLKADQLVNLIQTHAAYPFNLLELKDLFAGYGDITTQVEDLLAQNKARLELLERFNTLLSEASAIQDRLGYFTVDGLATRDKIVDIDVEPKDIPHFISLLSLPFIKAVHEITPGKYIFALQIRDAASLFHHIGDLLYKEVAAAPQASTPIVSHQTTAAPPTTSTSATKYYLWQVKDGSVIAQARADKPYKHHCPVEHFCRIVNVILLAYQTQNVVGIETVSSLLEGKDLAPNRPFRSDTEIYKVRMALGILEIEKFVQWTGSKRPVEYTLQSSPTQINAWLDKSF